MPCVDCVTVTAELASQKTFMLQWFNVLAKQLQSVEAKTAEFRKDTLSKLDILLGNSNRRGIFEHQQEEVYAPSDYAAISGSERGPFSAEFPGAGTRTIEDVGSIRSSSDSSLEHERRVKTEVGVHTEGRADIFRGTAQVAESEDATGGTSFLDFLEKQRDSAEADEIIEGTVGDDYREIAQEPSFREFTVEGDDERASTSNQSQLFQGSLDIPYSSKRGRKKKQMEFAYPKNMKVACNLCRKEIVPAKQSALSHAAVHLGLKPFQCPFCPMVKIQRHLVDHHVRMDHKDRDPLPTIRRIPLQQYSAQLEATIKHCFGETKFIPNTDFYAKKQRTEDHQKPRTDCTKNVPNTVIGPNK